MRGATRRKKTGKECSGGEHYTRSKKGERIAWADSVQDLGKNAASG
jgi:hypothetical protein